MIKRRDIKLITTERRSNYLVSEPNYFIFIKNNKFFCKTLLAIEMKITEILTNKPFDLGLSMLTLSEILIYEFWYDYVKPKYDEKAKLCYVDTDIVYIRTVDIYKDIPEDVKIRFDTSNYELDSHY